MGEASPSSCPMPVFPMPTKGCSWCHTVATLGDGGWGGWDEAPQSLPQLVKLPACSQTPQPWGGWAVCPRAPSPGRRSRRMDLANFGCGSDSAS